jgi:hypothetical protein
MKSKTRKILIGCFGIITIIFLILIAVSLYLTSAIFDDKPIPPVERVPNYEDLKSATDKITGVLNIKDNADSGNSTLANLDLDSIGLGDVDLENSEDLNFGEILKKVDLGKAMKALTTPGALVGTLTFSKEEVNALIDAGLSADQVQKKVREGDKPAKTQIYDAGFSDGRLTIKMSVNSDIPTFFGSYCNVEIVFTPQVIDHHLKLDLYSTKIGSISVPVSYFKDSIDEQLKIYEQTEDGQAILSIVKSLKVNKESVELKYDLQRLSVFALQKLPEIQQLRNSNNKAEDIMKLFK